jgi:hypothetical protein
VSGVLFSYKAGYEYIPGEISYRVEDVNNTNGSIVVQLNGFKGGVELFLYGIGRCWWFNL